MTGTEPDVALIDATHSLTTAAETVARLGRSGRSLGVVVVADGSRPALPTLPIHPKWGPFESLCLAVEQARRESAGEAVLVAGDERRSTHV